MVNTKEFKKGYMTMLSRLIAIATLVLCFPLASIADELIPYEVLEQTSEKNVQLVMDIRVPLIDGKLPKEVQLAAIAQVLIDESDWYLESTIRFWLPDMELGFGAFATAFHRPVPVPKMNVVIQTWRLMLHPEYKRFVKMEGGTTKLIDDE